MIYYNSYRNYISKKFGKPVLKIPINAGFSCPNRDGTKSDTGCHFCDNVSFSPAAENSSSPVQQLQSAILKASRFSAFIAYLQPYSNTYGSVQSLKSIYEPLLEIPGVVGLALGTRPDCFTNNIFDYLTELSSRTYLSVELGLQSAHDSTLDLINRHHTFADFKDTVERLDSSGIESVAHIMLGLPGENSEMMMETAEKLSILPVSGVKIHQLMIIKGTFMQNLYESGMLNPPAIEEYAELLCGFLKRLRPDQKIHRIMADSKSDFGLLAPQWSESKSSSINFIHEYMKKSGLVQGSDYLKMR